MNMNNWNEDWIDITYPIFENCTGWPDQPAVSFDEISHVHCGEGAKVSILHLSAHTGTHMDGPNHFVENAPDIASFPLSVGMGPVRVADLDSEREITPDDLEKYEFRTRPIKAGERLFMRTKNSNEFWLDKPFNYGYLAIGNAAADWLAERKVALVGVDYLSVGPYETTPATHRSLINGDVWIVEGLDLREIEEGDYETICMPLKIKDCDGSPARVLLKKR
ncbi:arylformamidase [Lewinellaceae bacterium SD302]|nr:arylformamidase [Lewinellaceae bacterium SD302]